MKQFSKVMMEKITPEILSISHVSYKNVYFSGKDGEIIDTIQKLDS